MHDAFMKKHAHFSLFFFISLSDVLASSVEAQPVSEISPSGSSSSQKAGSYQVEPHCIHRFREAFSQLSVIEWKTFEKQRPFSESMITNMVDSLFMGIPAQCETQAYTEFMDKFDDIARSALRAKNFRNSMLVAAIRVLKYTPHRIPFSDGTSAKSRLASLRSHLDTLREELNLDIVKPSFQKRLLQEIALLQPPSLEEPPKDQTADDKITIQLPTIPLPAWAVGTLTQVKELLHKETPTLAEMIEAKTKLQFVIDWISHPVLNAKIPEILGPVPVLKSKEIPLPGWAVETLYDLWLNSLQQEIMRREVINQSGALEKMKPLLDAMGKLDAVCKWLEVP